MTSQLTALDHRTRIDGPPDFQAYGASCSCGWIGPVQILKVSAEMDAEHHANTTGHKQ